MPSVVQWRQGEEARPLLDLLPVMSNNILYKDKTVKEALDELFAAFSAPLLARGWQKFTETGEFTVPEGVTRVLVMCIGAGSSTASTRGGGTLVSRYLPVSPGESLPVKVGEPQPLGKNMYNNTALEQQYVCSSFGGTTLQASWRGKYVVDGGAYTFLNSSPTFPAALDGKGMNTASAIPGSGSSSSQGTSGTGGFAVAPDVPDERAAWLEVARDLPPGKAPSGTACYPDATSHAGSGSGLKAGAGADHGGSAGHWSLSSPSTTNAAYGGKGLVCVFWGDDIEKTAGSPSPAYALYRKEDDTTITPLDMMVDASHLPYLNEEAGLAEGSTIADALDLLHTRLAEQKEHA